MNQPPPYLADVETAVKYVRMAVKYLEKRDEQRALKLLALHTELCKVLD